MFELLLGSTIKKIIGATWFKLSVTDTPVGLSEPASATWKANVYFVGGYNTGTSAPSAALYRYNPVNGNFTRLRDMPQPLRYCRAIMGDGKMFVWGGYNGTAFASVFYAYTISTDTWATVTVQATAADRPGCANAIMGNLGTDIYILGGYGGDASVDGTANFSKYVPTTNTWTKLAPFPNAIVNGTMIAYDDKLYVAFGGSVNNTVTQKEMYSYNYVTNTWTKLLDDTTLIDGPRYGANVAIFGNKFHYWGGASDKSSLLIYSPEDNQFTVGGTIPTELRGSNRGGFVMRNKFYSLGDNLGSEFWSYDPYFGKPKPDLVIIPFQEFYTSTAFCTAAGVAGSTGSTITYNGLNWLLIRYGNETWILPQKSLRNNCDLGSVNAYIGGTAKTIDGYSYFLSGIRDPSELSSGQWPKLYGRVSLTSNAPSIGPYTKLAKFSDLALGFGTYACYEWTSLTNGAYDTIAVGGTPAGTSTSLNNTSGRAQLRPFIKVNSVDFPW